MLEDAIAYFWWRGWDAYPVTIVSTRYGGAYEDGDWVAFPCDPHNLVDEAWDGGDNAADTWWCELRRKAVPHGVGSTPQEAFDSLMTLHRSTKWKEDGFPDDHTP